MITFFIPGVPAPGGSKTGFPLKSGRVIMAPACKRTKPWMAVCAVVARQAMQDGRHELLTGPLRLDVDFFLPRIKGHYRANGALKPNAPIWHTVKPDRTKLLRALEDALTGIVWRDDSAVVCGESRKLYGDCAGARVTVTAADETEIVP